jgi:hypothetical protein
MVPIGRGLLRRLRTLSAPEWTELVWAQWTLIRVQLLLWTRPRRRLVVPSGGARGAVGDGGEVTPEMRRLALAVERAAEYGLYRPSCVVRSLALHRMLGSRGIRGSAVRVGARLERGHFTAHAWVEYNGHVLGDRDWHVKKFAELAQMEVDQPS